MALALLLVAGSAASEAPREVSPAQMEALVSAPDGPLLLDVRSAGEFAAGHIPGALLIPVSELPDRLHQIEAYKTRGVVAYCERGGRATRALEILEEAGFSNLSLLAGNMQNWRDEKRETAPAK